MVERSSRTFVRAEEAEESRQSCAADIFTSSHKEQDRTSNERHASWDFGPYFGGKERQRVPGQQVPAKTESQAEEEQYHAAYPCQLARLAIGTQKGHAKHVSERHEDHQVGGPGMHRTH